MRKINKTLRYIALGSFIIGLALAATSAMLAQGKVGIEIGPQGIRYVYDESLWAEGIEDYSDIQTLEITNYDIPVYIEEGKTDKLTVDYLYRGEATELTLKKDASKLIVEKKPSNTERFISMGIQFDEAARNQQIKIYLPKGQKMKEINAKSNYLYIYGAQVGKIQNIADKGYTSLTAITGEEIAVLGTNNHTILSGIDLTKSLKVSSFVEDNKERKINADNGYLELENVTAPVIDTNNLFQGSIAMTNVTTDNDISMSAQQMLTISASKLKNVVVDFSSSLTIENTEIDGKLKIVESYGSSDSILLENITVQSIELEGEHVNIKKSTIENDITVTRITNSLQVEDVTAKNMKISEVSAGAPLNFEKLTLDIFEIEGESGYAQFKDIEAKNVTIGAEQIKVENSTITDTLTLHSGMNHNSIERVNAEKFVLTTIEGDTTIRNADFGTTTIDAANGMVNISKSVFNKNTEIKAESIFVDGMNNLSDYDVKLTVPEDENIFIPGDNNISGNTYIREKKDAKKLYLEATDGSINLS